MEKSYNVKINGMNYRYEENTSYERIAREFQKRYRYPIVLVLENGELREMHKKVEYDTEIEFISLADHLGNNAYRRTASMMLFKAYQDVTGKLAKNVRLCFSIPGGYYFIIDDEEVTEELVAKLKDRMMEMAELNLPVEKKTISTKEARRYFLGQGMKDKENLFRFRRSSAVNIYQLEDYQDYFYGYMLPSTEYVQYFDIKVYEDGIALMLPDWKTPFDVPELTPSPKLFAVRDEFRKMGDKFQIGTIGDLNNCISKGEMEQIRLIDEANQAAKIAEIGNKIAEDSRIKIVCIAGPSSSGKTTFSRRLSIQLKAKGLNPHPISLDNYYKERKDTPRDENGDYDFECLESLDLDLFRKQMEQLLNGERIELPRYNFGIGGKEYKGDFLQMGENDILVIEGIHGLNEKLSYFIPKEQKFKIYISALTLLRVDEHNRVATTDGRLIRRIVRDYKFRATSAQRTINMWKSVRRGEELYIFPFQEEADVIFNSALSYEMSILKIYAEPLLFQVPENSPEYLEAKRLLKFLEYFIGMSSEDIPNNSILREFVGGSCFDV